MNNKTANDFHRIVVENIPLIDVRAPIEFEKGAFPTSINLPFMNDQDRHLIGIRYKEKGHESAIELGHQLVCGDIRKGRTDAWINYLDEHPEALLYCFRGGSRSQITQEWIKESSGKEILRLDGGYKAFRNYLMDQMSVEAQTAKPLVLGGHTGSGKTLLLKQLDNVIDLEGLANHRGSAFGPQVTPQPSQIDFENRLAYALIQHQAKGFQHMILEDEGRHVGANFIGKEINEYFQSGGLVIVEVPFEERVQITLDEYVIHSQQDHIAHYGNETGLEHWYQYIVGSFNKVQRKLGGKRHQEFVDIFDEAYHQQLATNRYTPHEGWISLFLEEYYDPMYNYQLSTTTREIVFRGDKNSVLDYLKAHR